MKRYSRTELLIGESAQEKLTKTCVAVFGLGGVGSFTAEALARAGVGKLVLVDKDIVDETNINRQLYALSSTIGKSKVDVARERIKDINENIEVETYKLFFNEETKDEISLSGVDYIVDAIDTVTAKLALIELAKEKGIKIISSMGTGNKLDPTRFEIDDITKTSVCPLAKVMRKELKKRGIESLKVLYSKEEPKKLTGETLRENGKQTAGSISFVPSVAGLILAGEVIKDLIK